MKFQKGDLLNIQHRRKGFFKAIAIQDFDTETKEWYPVVVAPDEYIEGATKDWEEGASIPCRASLVSLILKEEKLEEPT